MTSTDAVFMYIYDALWWLYVVIDTSCLTINGDWIVRIAVMHEHDDG